jgi:GntR family transcriptional regulator/MocR family aminotransferase
MPKRVTAFELMLPAREPETPVYRWIYAALRTEILEGRLRPGSRLPSSRDLASQYRLSRGTIVTAFEQLKWEGYIEGTIGSGSYVSKVLPEQLLNVTTARAELHTFRSGTQAKSLGVRSSSTVVPSAGTSSQPGLPSQCAGVRPVSDDAVGPDRSPQISNGDRNPLVGLRSFRIPAATRGYRRLS